MTRIALGLEYAGEAFQGWQTQPHGQTVQDALQAAMAKVAGEPIEVVCAGRTDTGVHAAAQVVHFDTALKRPLTAWVRGVNTFLPDGVVVNWSVEVDEQFHARFSALTRRYRYLLINRPVRPGLLHHRIGWHHAPLDVAKMARAAACLLGEHDFSSFRSSQCQAKSPVRRMLQASVAEQGGWIVFDFEANAFLHHMVRNMVGALVHVGKEGLDADWLAQLIAQRDRRRAPPTFSPDGLYLAGVTYPGQWNLPNEGRIIAPLFLPAEK